MRGSAGASRQELRRQCHAGGLWGYNYQGGYNFLASANGPANNKVQVQMAILGLSLRF